jgi:hypothetical protein
VGLEARGRGGGERMGEGREEGGRKETSVTSKTPVCFGVFGEDKKGEK